MATARTTPAVASRATRTATSLPPEQFAEALKSTSWQDIPVVEGGQSGRRPSRPTIADVARRAGVSPAAVSFAMNDRPGVAEATRRRILDAAAELGWRPSRGADDALAELLEGIRRGDGLDTPPLAPDAGGPLRSRELASGVGAREL
jgi:hypothetical protein